MKQFCPVVCCCFWIAMSVQAQTGEEKKETIAYLRNLQTPNGGFLPATPQQGKEAKPNLRASSSALRALKYFGGSAKDAESCAKFVGKCFDKESGGFADQPGGKPDITSTAIGLMAVVELKMPARDIREAAIKFLGENAMTFEEIRIAAAGLEAVDQRPKAADAWIAQLLKMRNDDGTFGKDDGQARDTGGATVVLLRLGAKLEHQENVLKAVRMGQRKDGAFGVSGTESSDLESTYRVMRLLHMLREKPADMPALKTFVSKCRNSDGGYGVAPGQPSSTSATYFAGVILHWLEE
jgi:prenyltransferase beta subunit